jgi:hypothetical protein
MVCFAVTNSECIALKGFLCVCACVCVCGGGRGGIRDDELERIWKEAVLIYSRLYPHVFLVGMYEL